MYPYVTLGTSFSYNETLFYETDKFKFELRANWTCRSNYGSCPITFGTGFKYKVQ